MNSIFDKVGFNVIIEALAQESKLVENKRNIPAVLKLQKGISDIQNSLNETQEAGLLLETGISFIERDFSIIPSLLNRMTVEGVVFFEDELKHVLDLLNNMDIIHYAIRNNDSLVNLNQFLARYDFPTELFKKLNYFILPDGTVNLESNKELKSVTNKIASVSASIRSKAVDTLKVFSEKGKATLDSQPTILNGRLVIPVHSEFKRDLDGVVHDVSSTGQTTYIEPKAIITLNNELRELEIDRKRILYNLFKEISIVVIKHLAYLHETYIWIQKIDLLLAKASLSKRLGGEFVEVTDNKEIDIQGAKNPLLILKEGLKNVVSFDLKLNTENRVLIISGPNSGGKSVLLKTLGLFQLMLQAGILLPVDKGSVHVFNQLFIDIGDDQSVEDELSTYTAHMKNMVKVLNGADDNSLFLFDEFGAGTDPESGGKIAAEILVELLGKGSFGVISTHYEEIKEIGSTDGCLNGAMQFDMSSLMPLYTLVVGVPGRSFAFEVSQNVGLSKEILTRAKNRFDADKISYDQKLKELNIRESVVTTKSKELNAQEVTLNKMTSQYKELIKFYELKKERLLEKATREVSQEINTLRKGLKEVKNLTVKRSVPQAKELLKVIEDKTNSLIKVEDEDKELVNPVVGQKARVRGSDNKGEILSIKGNVVELLIGALKVKTKLSGLVEVRGEKKKVVKSSSSSVERIRKDSSVEFNSTIDIRGKRVDEALIDLENYLDKALLSSAFELNIIHGKGNGVLREVVRNMLKEYKEVKSIKNGPAEGGGDGLTIVSLV